MNVVKAGQLLIAELKVLYGKPIFVQFYKIIAIYKGVKQI